MNKKRRFRIVAALGLFLLVAFGPVSYSGGVLQTQLEWQDKYFSARVDLVPIVDKVLKDNTALKVMAKELLRSIEFKDIHINEQQGVIAGQDWLIGSMADEILELENRPPVIVEVETIIKVEKIVEVEVPGPIEYIYLPAPPITLKWEATVWDDSGSDNVGGEIKSDPEPDPEPEPDDDCDRHKRDKGKGHHKGHWGHKK